MNSLKLYVNYKNSKGKSDTGYMILDPSYFIKYDSDLSNCQAFVTMANSDEKYMTLGLPFFFGHSISFDQSDLLVIVT